MLKQLYAEREAPAAAPAVLAPAKTKKAAPGTSRYLREYLAQTSRLDPGDFELVELSAITGRRVKARKYWRPETTVSATTPAAAP